MIQFHEIRRFFQEFLQGFLLETWFFSWSFSEIIAWIFLQVSLNLVSDFLWYLFEYSFRNSPEILLEVPPGISAGIALDLSTPFNMKFLKKDFQEAFNNFLRISSYILQEIKSVLSNISIAIQPKISSEIPSGFLSVILARAPSKTL